MAKPRQNSEPGLFWTFVTENPQLASSIAFEIGYLAGKISRGASFAQIKKLSPNFADAVPQIAQAALKFLPASLNVLELSAGHDARANGAKRVPRKRKARKRAAKS